MFRKKRSAKKSALTPHSNGYYSTYGKSPPTKKRWDLKCKTHSDTQEKQKPNTIINNKFVKNISL
jgi:hypothetical protein